jgi:hypothetical protein
MKYSSPVNTYSDMNNTFRATILMGLVTILTNAVSHTVIGSQLAHDWYAHASGIYLSNPMQGPTNP